MSRFTSSAPVALLAAVCLLISANQAPARSEETGRVIGQATDKPTVDRATILRTFTQVVDDQGGKMTAALDFHLPFAVGSARLGSGAAAQLDALGAVIAELGPQGYRFALYGHTDASGSVARNETLSRQRAEAVADYLQRKWAIPTAWLDVQGLAATRLLDAANPFADINRRVEAAVTRRPSPFATGASGIESDNDAKPKSGRTSLTD